MQSQDVQPIDSFNYTPEPLEDHPIDRDPGAEAPEPIATDREAPEGPPVQPLEPINFDRQGPEGPQPITFERENEAAQPEPIAFDRQGAEGPEPIAVEREQAAGLPEPIAYEREQPGAQVEPVILDRQNEAEAPQPIDYVDRERAPVPDVPQVTIDTPPDYTDPRRLVFRQGPTIRDTYWIAPWK